MKRFLWAIAIAVAGSSISFGGGKVTTATLTAEYNKLQQQVAEGQAQMLRLEGAIRVLELNAEDKVTTGPKDVYAEAGIVH